MSKIRGSTGWNCGGCWRALCCRKIFAWWSDRCTPVRTVAIQDIIDRRAFRWNWHLFGPRRPGTSKSSCPRGSRIEIWDFEILFNITYVRRSNVTVSSWSKISKQVFDSSNSTIGVSYINQETPLRHFGPANSGRSTASSSLLFGKLLVKRA